MSNLVEVAGDSTEKPRDLSDVVIESERLTIKPISLDYADDIFREYNLEIAEFMMPQPSDEQLAIIEKNVTFIESLGDDHARL